MPFPYQCVGKHTELRKAAGLPPALFRRLRALEKRYDVIVSRTHLACRRIPPVLIDPVSQL